MCLLIQRLDATTGTEVAMIIVLLNFSSVGLE